MITELKRYLPAALGLLLAALAGPACPDSGNGARPDRIYDVEIILFRNESVPRGEETVPPTTSPERPANSIDFNNPRSAARARKQGFRRLTKAELRLKAERKRIDNSRRYRVLLHMGWRQPGLAAADARAIRIRGGRYYDASYASIDQEFSDNPSPESPRGRASGRRGLFELEGWIRVSLSRYLHTEADLVLREPADTQQRSRNRRNPPPPVLDDRQRKRLVNYPLKEKRRMRSKRLHYLDHPEYGLLVLITPYPPPAAEATAATPDGAGKDRKAQ